MTARIEDDTVIKVTCHLFFYFNFSVEKNRYMKEKFNKLIFLNKHFLNGTGRIPKISQKQNERLKCVADACIPYSIILWQIFLSTQNI